jgi:type IV pilus assembly protein PilV
MTSRRRIRRANSEQGGFTLVELLISLTVLIIGLTGILTMQVTAMRATGFSRHSTEAAVLAEDKMEFFRTTPLSAVVDDTETVNAHGLLDADGLYTREWTITDDSEVATISVTVSWMERGDEPHAVTIYTQRSL